MVKQKSQQQWPVQVITKAERRAYSPTCFEHNDLNAEVDWNYRVKWEGYSSENDSWEPYQHVQGCVRLLASFWDHVGINKKHDVSCKNVTASEDWIEDWIKRDERPPGKTVNTKNQRQMVQRRKDKKKHTRGPSFVSIPSSSKVAEDESGNDSAQGEPPKLSLKIKLPPGNLNKRRVISSPASDEESLTEGSRPRKVARTQADGNTDAVDNEIPLSPNSLFSEWSATETALVEAVQEFRLIKSTEPKIVPVSGISTKQRLASGALIPTTPKEIMDQSRRINSNPLFINRSGARGLKSNQKPFQQVNSTVSESTISFDTGFQSFTLEHTTEFPQEFRDIRYLYSDWLGTNTFDPSAIMPIETLACERIKEATIWTGPLHLDSEIALCNIKIHDATETMFTNISDILLDKEKIEISGTYDISDIQSALSAFRQPLQIGQLYPREEADSESLGILSKYLYKLKRVFTFPTTCDILDNDSDTIGQALPICLSYFLYCMLLPDGLKKVNPVYQPEQLILIALPYTLSKSDIEEQYPCRSTVILSNNTHYPTKNIKMWQQLCTKPQLYYALSFLNIHPHHLQYNDNDTHIHSYGIWTKEGAKETEIALEKCRGDEMETRLLEILLNEVKAKKSTTQSNFKVFFVHASALKLIYQMPEFVGCRTNIRNIDFYLYGSNPGIPASLCSVREIWPCGGIVTFTPSAIEKNPRKIYTLITQIDQHPLWACYILPQVLAKVVIMECGTEDPLEVSDKRKLLVDMILHAIAEGYVSLIEAPPENPTIQLEEQWKSKYIALIAPSKREALVSAIGALGAMKDPSPRAMGLEISSHMSRMHRHPAFITSYRRYVVICSERDDITAPKHYGGFEWTTAVNFDFKDNFYQLTVDTQ